MNAIVAVDLNWGIGCNGKLLNSIPEDMKFFKKKTSGNVVVMGRETFESLPGKKPLLNRINIVLSRNPAFNDDRLIVCRSVDETVKRLSEFDDKQIFIIGGEAVYKQFLPYCDTIYVTKIYNKKDADRFFPDIDHLKEWKKIDETEMKEHNKLEYKFLKYIKVSGD